MPRSKSLLQVPRDILAWMLNLAGGTVPASVSACLPCPDQSCAHLHSCTTPPPCVSQVAPAPGARFSPAFLEAVAAWAAVQQQRRLSPAQRLVTPPPPPPPLRPPPMTVSEQPTTPAVPPADTDTVLAGSEGGTAEEADVQSPQKLSCSNADAPASVGSAASVMSQQVADGAEGPEQDAAVEAGQSPPGAVDGSPWEDYSSAAWIAEALTGLQVNDDAQRGPEDGQAAEAVVKASAGSSSVEAAALARGMRPSTSGDDSDEVTSPLIRLSGQDGSKPCQNKHSKFTR